MEAKFTIKDMIQLVTAILALAGIYTALTNTDVKHESEIQDLKEDIERLEQRDEWFTRELELLR